MMSGSVAGARRGTHAFAPAVLSRHGAADRVTTLAADRLLDWRAER
jgi:hypothetical protein